VDVRNGACKVPIEGPKNTSISARKHRTPISICQLKEDKGLLNCSSWENTAKKKEGTNFPTKIEGRGA